MKTKITLIATAVLLYLSSGLNAQTSCPDLNGFVNSKNVGPTGSYVLKTGFEEYGSQTYHYAGPGKVSGARIYGNYPALIGGVPLRIGVANVDAAGRPTTMIQTINTVFWAFDNSTGYINVTFGGGGVTVNNSFAITVQVLSAFPFGNTFNLQYTGNGEGLNQDLASLAGTSTGFNWTSAMSNFSKNGDFYLVPRMQHFITSDFTVASQCVNTSAPVNFSNTTLMTKDSMFNKITWSGYTGSNKLYTWNFGDGSPVSNATNPSHTYTLAGVYTVTLTSTIDGWNGVCSNSYTKKISVGLSVSTPTVNNVLCNGGNSGSIVAAGAGGAPTYSYSLNDINYQTSPTFTGMVAGTYMVYVKDIVGCKSSTTFNITQPTPITFLSSSSTNASCGSSNGSILVSATGGVGTLQYQLNSGPFQATGSFTNLPVGLYFITAKDANSCTTSTLEIINDFGGPVLTANSTNVSCNGANDGSITLSSTGGTGLIQYSINGGISFQTSGSFPNVTAGTYSVIVKDAAGCTDVKSVLISQPLPIMVTSNSSSVTCNGSSNGQINVTSSTGGIGTHNYSVNGINYQFGTNFSGLAAGTYTVYAKDVAGCIGTTTIAIAQPLPISASVVTTSASCFDSNTGSISVSATGGSGNYVYSINGVDFQKPGTFIEVGFGTYTVTVRDINNCTYTTTAVIAQPPSIAGTVNTTNSTCGNNNGGILVIGSGGSGSGYQYSMDGTTFNSTGLFSSLAAGTYYILIKDGAGCTKVVFATIVDSNGPVIVSHNHTNVSCNNGIDGSITVTSVTGGTGLLQYSLNGIIWQTSPTFTSLPAGVYNVTVKDANSCTGNATLTLTQPNAFVITSITTSLSCYGTTTGASTISASGGSGILAYSINGGLSYQSSSYFSNLGAGSYTIIVKDAANCQGEVTVYVAEPTEVKTSLGILNVSCNGANDGAMNITAWGGSAPYMYSLNGTTYTSSSSFTGLAGNTNYIAYVKDAKNCIKTQTFFISQPAVLNVSGSVSNVNCSGGNNGGINLSVSGGSLPYTYQWSNGSTNQSIFNLSAGTYTVVVTDLKGCTSTKTFVVSQPTNPMVVNGVITSASTSSSNDGSINITVTGGVGPYVFSWSNGATTQNISGLNPGAYLVTITDANGCITSATYIVGNFTNIAGLVISGGDIVLYPNPASSTATIDAKGNTISKVELINLLGQKVYSSEPNNSIADIDLSNMEVGTYFVKIYIGNSLVTKKISVVK